MTDITIYQTRLPTGLLYRVYYYQGNIFRPLDLPRKEEKEARQRVKNWIRANRARVDKDRSEPDYRTLVELFDEQQAMSI